jgi:hypothetical protein
MVSSQYLTLTSRHEGYARPLFEYDCSESNNDAVNILAGARRAEREAKGVSGKPISHRSN